MSPWILRVTTDVIKSCTPLQSAPEQLPKLFKPWFFYSVPIPIASLQINLYILAYHVLGSPQTQDSQENKHGLRSSCTTNLLLVFCLANSDYFSCPKLCFLPPQPKETIMLFLDKSLQCD